MRPLITALFLTLLAAPPALARQPVSATPIDVRPSRDFGAETGAFDHVKNGQVYKVKIYRVAALSSSAQTEDEFAVEVGVFLNRLTAINGVENCAQLFRAKDGSGFAAHVMTVGAQAVCPKLSYSMGDQYVATGLDIHSHIHRSTYNPSELDRVFLASFYGPPASVGTTPSNFSPGDFESPGYMVNRVDVKFQSGEAHVRRVAKLSESSFGTLVVSQSWSQDTPLILATQPSAAAPTIAAR